MEQHPHCDDDCPHAAEIADAAVKKAFYVIGIDINDAKQVEAFREDLRFGSAMRKVASQGAMTALGLFITAIFSVVISKIFGGWG